MKIKLRAVLTHLIDYLLGKSLAVAVMYAKSDCMHRIGESLSVQDPYVYIYYTLHICNILQTAP